MYRSVGLRSTVARSAAMSRKFLYRSVCRNLGRNRNSSGRRRRHAFSPVRATVSDVLEVSDTSVASVLASLMYRSQLVPRAIAVLGLIGGPVVFSSSVAILVGLYEQVSAVAAVAALQVFAPGRCRSPAG